MYCILRDRPMYSIVISVCHFIYLSVSRKSESEVFALAAVVHELNFNFMWDCGTEFLCRRSCFRPNGLGSIENPSSPLGFMLQAYIVIPRKFKARDHSCDRVHNLLFYIT